MFENHPLIKTTFLALRIKFEKFCSAIFLTMQNPVPKVLGGEGVRVRDWCLFMQASWMRLANLNWVGNPQPFLLIQNCLIFLGLFAP